MAIDLNFKADTKGAVSEIKEMTSALTEYIDAGEIANGTKIRPKIDARALKEFSSLSQEAQKEAEELINAFNAKSGNKKNDYFTTQQNALKALKSSYRDYESHLDNGSSTKQDIGNIVRWGNAYQALGGNIDEVDEKIRNLYTQFAPEKNNLKGYDYTIERFTELFDIMKKIQSLGFNMGEFSKNFYGYVKPSKKTIGGEWIKKLDSGDMTDLLNTEAIEGEIDRLQNALKDFGDDTEEFSQKQITEFASLYNQLLTYFEMMGKDIPSEYSDMMNKVLNAPETKTFEKYIKEITTNHGTKQTIFNAEKFMSDSKFDAEGEVEDTLFKVFKDNYKARQEEIKATREAAKANEEYADSVEHIGNARERREKAVNRDSEARKEYEETRDAISKIDEETEETTEHATQGGKKVDETIQQVTVDLTELLDLLKKIFDSFGEIDSETGLNKLTSTIIEANKQFDDMVNKLSTISSRLRDANFSKTVIDDESMLLSQKRQAKVDKVYADALSRTMKSYDKVMSVFSDNGVENPFTALWASSEQLQGMYSIPDALSDIYSRDAIQGLDKVEDKLRTVQELLNLVRDVASSNAKFDPFWKELLNTVDSIPKAQYGMSYVNSKKNEILDIKRGKEDQNNDRYASIIRELQTIQEILNNIAKDNPLVMAITEATSKLEEFSNTLIETFSKISVIADKVDIIPQNNVTTSVDKLDSEADSFSQIKLTAEQAAAAKLAFVEANKKVADSIDESVTGINEEVEAFDNISQNKDSLGMSSVRTGNTIETSMESAQDAIKEVGEEADKTAAKLEDVIYHAGEISRLNKAETNGRFYGSTRGSGYYGTGHYFLSDKNKLLAESGNNGYGSKPFTSIDKSFYTLLKENNDGAVHSFARSLTLYTQEILGKYAEYVEQYDPDFDNEELKSFEDFQRDNNKDLYQEYQEIYTEAGHIAKSYDEFNDKLMQLIHHMESSSLDDRSDSVFTKLNKWMGYEGVDTSGTNMDSTFGGTVIYDLKEASILQANITDEIQKQSQMLDRIDYSKQSPFNQDIDDELKNKVESSLYKEQVDEEYNKLYSSYQKNLDEYLLQIAKDRLKHVENMLSEYSVELSDEEIRDKILNSRKELSRYFDDEFNTEVSKSDIEEERSERKDTYNSFSEEKNDLLQRITLLETNIEKEEELSRAARERAKEIVDSRKYIDPIDDIDDLLDVDDLIDDEDFAIDSSESVENIEKEKDKFDELSSSADEAALSKEKFDEANGDVAEGVDKSANKLDKEINKFDEIKTVAESASDAVKELMENAPDNPEIRGDRIIKGFKDIQGLLNGRDIISQTNDKIVHTDIDPLTGDTTRYGRFAFVERLMDGRTQRVMAEFDDETGLWYETVMRVDTAFEQVGNEVLSLDEKIRKLIINRDKMVAEHPGYNTDADNRLIELAQQRRQVLLDTLAIYSDEEQYQYESLIFDQRRLENAQRLDALQQQSQNKQDIKQQEKDRKADEARQKRIERVNNALDTQKQKILDIQATYDKNVNAGVTKPVVDKQNDKALTELNQKKQDVENAISRLQNTEASSSELTNIKNMIKEYQRLAKIKQGLQNATKKEMGAQDINVLISKTVEDYTALILKAKQLHQYGYDTVDIIDELENQLTKLSKKNGKDYISSVDDYYVANAILKINKAEVGIIEKQRKERERLTRIAEMEQKATDKTVKSLYDKLAEINKLKSNANSIQADIIKDTDGKRADELNGKLKETKDALAKAKEELVEIFKQVHNIQSKIDSEDYKNMRSDYRAGLAERGSISSRGKIDDALNNKRLEQQKEFDKQQEKQKAEQLAKQKETNKERNAGIKDFYTQIDKVNKLQSEINDINASIINDADNKKVDELNGKLNETSSKLTDAKKELGEMFAYIYKIKGQLTPEDFDLIRDDYYHALATKGSEASQGKIDDALNKKIKNDATDENTALIVTYKQLNAEAKEYFSLLEKEQTRNITSYDQKRLDNLRQVYQDIINGSDKYNANLNATQKSIDLVNKEQDKFISAMSFEGVNDYIVDMIESLGKLETQMKTLSKSPKFTTDFINKIDNKISDIRTLSVQFSSLDINDLFNIDGTLDTNKLYNLIKSFKKLSGEITNLKKNATKDPLNLLGDTNKQLSKYLLDIEKTLQDSSAMPRRLRGEYDELKNKISDILENGNTKNVPKEQLVEIETELNKLDTELVHSGKNYKNLFSMLGERLRGINAQFIAQFFSIQDFIRYGREMANVIIGLDTALVDLRKTTTMNNTELDDFYLNSNKIAKSMGVTTQSIIEQAAAWSRLGYSSKEEVSTMAELSSQFASISPGMDTTTAQEGLVSTMKAFHKDTTQVKRDIMDNINIIGNTMATSNKDIVDMLERSSAAMAAANNSIQETIALESAAVEITQNAENTGTAFRTISMRIRGYDEETEEWSEDLQNISGDIADLTKTANNTKGISLFEADDPTKYKSTYNILKEISEIYGDLTDKQQAQLLEKLGGKRGGQVLAGLLEDFSGAEKALKNMDEAEGSADNEMGIVKDSIEYKINELKETWTGFLMELLNRKDVGELVDSAISASESLQGAIEPLAKSLKLLLDVLSPLLEGFGKFAELTGGLSIPLLGLGAGAVKHNVNKMNGKSDIWDLIAPNIGNASEVLETILKPSKKEIKKAAASYSDNDSITSILSSMIVTKDGIKKAISNVNPNNEAGWADKIVSQLGTFNEESILEALNDTDLLKSQKNAIINAIQKRKKNQNPHDFVGNMVDELFDTDTRSGNKAYKKYMSDMKSDFAELKSTGEEASDSFSGLKDIISDNVSNRLSQLSEGATSIGAAFRSMASGIAASTKELIVFLATDPIGWAILAAAAIAATGYAIYQYSQRVDKARESLRETYDIVNANSNAIKDHRNFINENIEEYAKLRESVDISTNENLNLSTEEYARYLELNNKLADIYPELIAGNAENGSYLLALDKNAESVNKTLNELLETEIYLTKIDNSKLLPNMISDAKLIISDDIKQIEKLKSEIDSINKVDAVFEDINLFNTPIIFDSNNIEKSNALVKAWNDTINQLSELRTVSEYFSDYGNEFAGLQSVFDDNNLTTSFTLNADAIKAVLDTAVADGITDITFDKFQDTLSKNLSSAANSAAISSTKDVIIKQSEIDKYQKEITESWKYVTEGLVSELDFYDTYNEFDDKTKKLAEGIISSLDSSFAETIDEGNYADFIQNEILNKLSELDVNNKIHLYNILNNDSNYDEIVNFINYLRNQEGFSPDDPIYLFIKTKLDEENEFDNSLVNFANKNKNVADRGFSSSYERDTSGTEKDVDWLREKTKDFTKDQKKEWLEVTKEAKDADDAWTKWEEHLKKTGELVEEAVRKFNVKDLEDTVSSLKTINGLYNTLLENEKAGKTGTKLAFGISDIENLKDQIKDADGNAIDLDEYVKKNPEFVNRFKEYEKILTEGTASADEMKDALNGMSTIFADVMLEEGDYSEETKQLVKTQLELAGATKESAEAYVEQKTALANAQKNLKEFEKFEIYDDQKYTDAIDAQNKYIDGLDDIYKKYGNIDNINRSQLIWTAENKRKYGDMLLNDWGIDVSEYETGVDWSTVLGDHKKINANGEEIEIAYSFMFDSGNELVPLSYDNFNSYLNELIKRSTDQETGKVDMNKVMELDSTGMEGFFVHTKNGVMKIKNMLAGYEGQMVGDAKLTADDIKAIAGETGDDIVSKFKGFSLHDVQAEALNASKSLRFLQDVLNTNSDDAEKMQGAYEELIQKTAQFVNGEIDAIEVEGFENIDTIEAVEALMAEAKAAGYDTQALTLLALQRLSVSDGTIKTKDDVQALMDLGAQAGFTEKDLARLSKIMDLMMLKEDAVQAYIKDQNQGNWERVKGLNAQIDAQLALFNAEVKNRKVEAPTIENSPTTTKAAGGAGGEAADAYVEEFEKELKKLDELKDAGVISEKEYLDRLKALYVKYFANKKQYYEKFKQYEKQYLEGMKGLYEGAISGAKTVINYQINQLQKEKDKAVKVLEEEKEAATKAIQDQIDALEEQKEALEKANEERQRAIDLQKAQYELERAQAQRTRLVYKDGQMVYEHDNDAVRDAKEDVRQKLLDNEIAEIDNQIDGLNKQLEETEKYYDELIKQTEKFYDEQIEALQDVLDMWEELESQLELAEALDALSEFGITMDDVLSGNVDTFNMIRDGIVGVSAALNGNKEAFAEAFNIPVDQIESQIDQILGYDPGTAAWVKEMQDAFAAENIKTDGLDDAKNKLDEVKEAAGGTGVPAQSGIVAEATPSSGATGAVKTLSDEIDKLKDKSLEALADQVKTIGEGFEKAGQNIEAIVSGIAGLAQSGVGLTTLAGDAETLASSLESVASILGVGGGEESDTTDGRNNGYPSASNTPLPDSNGKNQTGNEGGDGTLIGAFNELENINLSNTISQIGGEGADEETLTGVLTAANAQISGSSNGGAEDTSGMLGSLTAFDTEAEKIPNITDYFTKLNEQLESCQGNLWSMLEAIKQLAEAFKNMTFPGNTGTNGGIFTGTAYAKGNWSAKSKGKAGNSLVGELGQELVVHPNGRFETVGDNGAEFTHIGANDIVFNHKQTEELLKNGRINSRGKAYAGGKLPEGFSSLSDEDYNKYNLLGEVENLVEKLEFGNQKLITLDKSMDAVASNTTTNNYSSTPVINVNNPTFTCTGVTGEQVLHEIESSFSGLFVNAYQKSMTR